MSESSSIDSLHCPQCRYNLFGIENSSRCPECGLEIDRDTAVSRLPWSHRRQIGRVRAFFRTALLGTFRPRLIADEMNRPVSFADARKFRLICVGVAWVCVFIFSGALVCEFSELSRGLQMGIWMALGLGLWLHLIATTGLPSVFFHPSYLPVVRQNRAVALSYYSASPLAWTPVAMLLLTVSVLLDDYLLYSNAHWVIPLLVFAGAAAAALQLACFLGSTTAILKHSTGCGSGRRTLLMLVEIVCMPAFFYCLALGVPSTALIYAVAIESLR
jgi:hypothetical protein